MLASNKVCAVRLLHKALWRGTGCLAPFGSVHLASLVCDCLSMFDYCKHSFSCCTRADLDT